jgi:hypothetical protein
MLLLLLLPLLPLLLSPVCSKPHKRDEAALAAGGQRTVSKQQMPTSRAVQ